MHRLLLFVVHENCRETAIRVHASLPGRFVK
jgi:hypothetical protein